MPKGFNWAVGENPCWAEGTGVGNVFALIGVNGRSTVKVGDHGTAYRTFLGLGDRPTEREAACPTLFLASRLGNQK